MKKTQLLVTIVLSSTISVAWAGNSTWDNFRNNMSKTATEVGGIVQDSNITLRIKALLAMEPDIPLNIGVTTDNGVVSLSGKVDTHLQAARIIELSQDVEGVKSVHSGQLEVAKSDNYLADAAITMQAKVKATQLSNSKSINRSNNLHIETTNGMVHVFGRVGDRKDIGTLEKELKTIEGVKQVKVNLKVVKPAERSTTN